MSISSSNISKSSPYCTERALSLQLAQEQQNASICRCLHLYYKSWFNKDRKMNFDLIKVSLLWTELKLEFCLLAKKIIKYSVHRSACNKTKHAVCCFQNFYCDATSKWTFSPQKKKCKQSDNFTCMYRSFEGGKGGAGISQWSRHLEIKQVFIWEKKKTTTLF